MGRGNMRDPDGSIRGGMERETSERIILMEGAIMELGGNLVLGKFPGIHKDDPS